MKSVAKRGDPSAWLLLHCFIGPAIGTIAAAMVPLIAAGPLTLFDADLQWRPQEYAMIPIALLVVLLPGWFFGFIPALLHAVVMLLLRRVIPSRTAWLALTPVVGWLAVFMPLLVIAGVETPDRIIDSAWMALIGTAAALGCMAIALRKRIYPVG